MAKSARQSRRKHMISWARTPYWASASIWARRRPRMTVSKLTPRLVCAWGSKNTSA